MVNMIIDGKHISAEENITIMEAAERNGLKLTALESTAGAYFRLSTKGDENE